MGLPGRARRARVGLCGLLVLLGAGCSSSGAPDGSGLSGTVHVSAAASLTEVFGTLKSRFEKAHPRLKLVTNFGASSELVQQLAAGSPGDVLATADTRTMAQATETGVVDKAAVFARNRLSILVAKGNPRHITTLTDLAQPRLSFVLCAPEVPCGRFGQQVLDRAGVKAKPKSLEPNVKAAVTRVVTGEVDAALVYSTDVRAAGSKAEGVTIRESQNAVAGYPIAVVKSSKNKKAAQAFVDYVRSPAGRNALDAAGFLPPS